MSTPIEIEPIGVETPLGDGYAIIFESEVDENFWTVVISKTRAIVTFRQTEIRMKRSYTYRWDFAHEDMRKIIGLEE